MGWRSVIVTQHAKLSYTSHLMVVQTNDGINQIPIEDIELLLVSTTQAVITSALLSELAKREAKVIFVDNTLQPICETVSYYPNNRSYELIENEFHWAKHRKEILWTKIVAAKIINQLQVLDIYGHDISLISDELNQLELNDETNREAVVARKYFPLLFENEKFSRRSMTAVNAALNYGYSILLSTINRAIVTKGYLTQLGIHHQNTENQFNLGSDLMEPFRIFIDCIVYKLTMLKEKNFYFHKQEIIKSFNQKIMINKKYQYINNAIDIYVDAIVNQDLELPEIEFNYE